MPVDYNEYNERKTLPGKRFEKVFQGKRFKESVLMKAGENKNRD